MRRFSVLLAAILGSVLLAYSAHAEVLQLKSVKNRAAYAVGTLDSLQFSLMGETTAASETPETLQVVSTNRWLWNQGATTPTTSHGVAKLWITSQDAFQADSIYWAIQLSADGSTWTAPVYTGALTTAGAKVFGIPLTADIDATAGNFWRATAFRIFLRAAEDAVDGEHARIKDVSIVFERAPVPVGVYRKIKSVTSRAAAALGSLDSTTFSLDGTSVPDTLAPISLGDWDFSHFTGSPATSTPIAKVWVTTSTAIGGDSLYVGYQVSSDGGVSWSGPSTYIGGNPATAADKLIGIPIAADSDAVSENIWRAPLMRLLVRSDATSGVGSGLTITDVTLSYPKAFP